MPSPTSLSSVRADAIARRDRGDLHSARDLLERALEAAIMTSGEDHPEVLTTAHLLASLHRQAGDLSGARRVLENALYAGSSRHGDDHPLLLAISFDLAEIADELGNRHEARRHYTRVARYGPAAPGFNQQQVQAARAWLGPNAPAAAGVQGQPVTVPAPEPIMSPPPAPQIPPAEWPPKADTAAQFGQDGLPIFPQGPPATPTAPPPAAPATQGPPAGVTGMPRPAPPVGPRAAPQHPGQGTQPAQAGAPPPHLPAAPGAPGRAGAPGMPPAAAGPAAAQRPGPFPPALGTPPISPASAGYPPNQTLLPMVLGAPQLAPPPARPRRGTGVMVASIIAAVVAIAAATVTVYLVLRPGDKPPHTASEPPANVAIQVRDDRVTITWTDPSNGVAQPMILGNREGEGTRRFAIPPNGATETSITGLNKNYEYCFNVLLVYSNGDVMQSDQVCTNRKKPTPSPTR